MMFHKNDFIEIEYECTDKDSGKVVEKSNGKIIVPLGKNFIPKFIEEKILKEGKTEGEYLIKNAYGERREELIKVVNIREFYKRNIYPRKGMIVNIDGIYGKIIAISGGRVIVDFNHPYAGKEILAKFKVYRKVEDLSDKIKGILRYLFDKDIKFSIKQNEKIIEIEYDKKFERVVTSILKDSIPEIKEYKITFK